MKSAPVYLTLVCFITVLIAAAGRLDAAALDPVTVQLKWVHQAQFAGFYVALEKGYYADENLDVRLIPGGNEVDIAQSVMSGQADFGVMAPEEIFVQRSRGESLTAIAAIYRRSSVVYLSKADSGITRPKDFSGKTVAALADKGGSREFQLQLVAMMKNLGLDIQGMHLVAYDPTYEGFYNGSVDVTAAYTTGGLIKMRQKGLSPHIIWPGDYRVRFYSDTLVTTDRIIAAYPERVTRFLRATLKGWNEAVGNFADTITIILKYALIKDRVLQAAMFDALLPLVNTGEDRIGWMRAEAWREMHQVLVDQAIIPAPLSPVEQIFTLQFLNGIDKEKAP
jgi:NitT/TauT family transport system substrate-binding protein